MRPRVGYDPDMRSPHVLISGAGIAGPALAHWLAAAGWTTTVVERFDALRDTGQNLDVRGAAREVVRRMGLDDAVRGGDGTEYVFGDQITGLDARADGVTVRFARSPERTFDLVVVAEGLGSRTRALAFPDARTTDLGLYLAYLTIPRTPADDDRWRWYNAPRGRQVSLRPDNVGTIRAFLGFLSDVRGLEDLSNGDQARILRKTLLGDAAWCPSPLSGMGTSLALVGAYVLAGELTARDDHREAFARFEATMRPYVDKAQKLPPGTPRIAFPRTRTGVTGLRTALRVAASPVVQRLGGLSGRFFSPPADEIDLPPYRSVITGPRIEA